MTQSFQMKRPLAFAGFTFLAAAAVSAYLPVSVCLAVGLVLGLFALFAAMSRHPAGHTVALGLLIAGIACVAVMLQTVWGIMPAKELAGTNAEVSGEVYRVNSSKSIELDTQYGKIALTSREVLDVEIGDQFSAVAALSLYGSGNSTPYARRKEKTVPLRGYILSDYVSSSPDASTLRGALSRFKAKLSAELRLMLPGDEGKLLCGMLLGERQRVPIALNEIYSSAGISHILSISGYHIAVLSGVLTILLERLHVNRKIAGVVTIAFMLLYMGMVGFQPSIVRATIMAVFYQFALLFDRKNDSLTSLASAGIVICAVSPLSASETSFQLSFLATLGIILCSGRLESAIKKRLGEGHFEKARNFFVSSISVTLCATAFTLPVVVLSFEQVAVYAPLTNLLIAPLVPVVMTSGLLAMFLSLVPVAGIAMPFAFIAGVGVSVLNSVSTLIAGLPFARLPAGAGFVGLWMAGAGVLLALSMVKPDRKKFTVCGLLCAITLMTGMLSYQLTLRGATVTTILPTDGGTVMVAVKDGRAVVAGSVNTKSDVFKVRTALNSSLVKRIELLVLSPAEHRRGGAICALFEDYPVTLAVMEAADCEDERIRKSLGDDSWVVPWGDMSIKLMDGDTVRLYGGEVCAELSGIKTFLLTGECGIIESTQRFGNGSVTVLSSALPSEMDALRGELLVTSGIYGVMCPMPSVVLGDAPSAQYLAKEGRLRLIQSAAMG